MLHFDPQYNDTVDPKKQGYLYLTKFQNTIILTVLFNTETFWYGWLELENLIYIVPRCCTLVVSMPARKAGTPKILLTYSFSEVYLGIGDDSVLSFYFAVDLLLCHMNACSGSDRYFIPIRGRISKDE